VEWSGEIATKHANMQRNNIRTSIVWLDRVWWRVVVVAVGAVLVHQPWYTAHAFPNGAGQCIGGRAAVDGEHLTLNPVVTGSLVDGGLEVTINDGTTLTEDGGPYEIATNTDYTIAIGISSSGGFRGALIRAASSNGESDFTLQAADEFGQDATSVCTDNGVLGVTHVSNDIKPSLSATLNVGFVGTITLDITVVQAANDNDGSSYYYSPYTLTVVKAVDNAIVDSNSTETITTTTSSPVAAEPSPSQSSPTEPEPSPSQSSPTEPEPSPSEPSPSEPSPESDPGEPASAPAKSPTKATAAAAAPTFAQATAPSAPTTKARYSAPTKSSSSAATATGSQTLATWLRWVVMVWAITATVMV
jgi:hypothetical protein